MVTGMRPLPNIKPYTMKWVWLNPYTPVYGHNAAGAMGAAEARQFRRDLGGLKRNEPGLKTLDYEGIPLGNEGAGALAKALRSNTNLKRLSLGHCNIGPEGLHNLARSLCEDRLVPARLRKLELVSTVLV